MYNGATAPRGFPQGKPRSRAFPECTADRTAQVTVTVFAGLSVPEMDFSDRTLKCVACGNEFIVTADEQRFFHAKQFTKDPKHCKECKARRIAKNVRLRPE